MGDISKRLRKVETALWPGERITEEQAADLSLRIKALAGLLSEQHTTGKKNHYQGVFVELYRRFGVSNHKAIALDQFAQVLAFLDEWRQQVEGNTQTG